MRAHVARAQEALAVGEVEDLLRLSHAASFISALLVGK